MSFIKVLYFIVRYFGAIDLAILAAINVQASSDLSIETCKSYFLFSFGISPAVIVFALDTVLLLRLFALYRRSKRVLLFLSILLLCDFALVQWVNIKLAMQARADTIVAPYPWKGCVTKPHEKLYMLAGFVPNFTVSFLFLVMTLWKLVENHQVVYGKLVLKSLFTKDRVSPLLSAFVRDGSVFFTLCALNTVLQAMTAYVLSQITAYGLVPWILVLFSYVGPHLILDLRETGWKEDKDQPWMETMSSIPIQSIRFTT